MKRNPALIASTLALATAFALSACDRRDDAAVDDARNPPPVASQPDPAAMPDASTPATTAVNVTSVELGNEVGADNRVATPLSTFGTGDTVHASVVTDGRGGTVSTRWTFEDGQVVHTEDKVVPSGAQVTDFMVTNPAGWPAGRYTMEVMVDGQVVQTREYEVR